jgi:hypothetical protein
VSAPRYARLASKAFARERASIPPPPPVPERRAEAIAALELEIAARAHKRRVSRWVAALVAVAAGVAATVGVSRYVVHRSAPIAIVPPAPAQAVQIVARSIGGGSVGASGAAEARTLAAGSRVVTPPNERATLAFSTGTSVQIGGGADMTVVGEGASQVLRLDSGSIDLHVAKLAADQRFLVDTSDAEIEVRGTQFRVWIAPREPACGDGTATRVAVTEGVVVVRHAGD